MSIIIPADALSASAGMIFGIFIIENVILLFEFHNVS